MTKLFISQRGIFKSNKFNNSVTPSSLRIKPVASTIAGEAIFFLSDRDVWIKVHKIALLPSDIIANAVDGNCGNIDITTQGIFGLELRDELTKKSDITASSQSGVNGTVEINNVEIDPSSE